MTVRELLAAARDLVAKGWTQKTYARDEFGKPTPYGGRKACSFCMSGAILHASITHRDVYGIRFKALDAISDVIGRQDQAIAPWNDHEGRTQEEVLAVFDEAIELATASES